MRTLTGDERVQFEVGLRARNLAPPKEIIADGEFHRCNVHSRNGKGDGSYVIFAAGTVPAGGFQNWQDGLGWESWCYKPHGRGRTAAEDAEAAKKVEEARKRRDAVVAAAQERAAKKARRLWDAATPATSHPYLTRKRVQAHGARTLYNNNILVLPMRNADGELLTLQFIDKEGRKRFLKGGAKSGHFYTILGHRGAIYIAEGFATAGNIHECTGCTVIVAVDAGNLQPVAEAMRKKYPNAEIVICADDDWKTAGNPGLRKARAAARAINATIAVPDFGHNRRDRDTDFNDLCDFIGADVVKRCLASVMSADQCLTKQLETDPFSALQDTTAEELADLRQRDRSAFEQLRLTLRKAGVRSSVLDEAIDEQEQEHGDEVSRLKQVDVLLDLVTKNSVELFHTADQMAFAAFRIHDHREIYPVKSSDFRRWLRNGFFDEKKSAPSSEAMTSSVATIDALAVRKGEEHDVHLRVAELDGNYYLDLCDAAWRAVEITPEGWRILSEPPVRFRRKSGMLPLPTPVPGGSIDLLRPFLNINGDDDFVLLVSYLLAALSPRGPYPVLAITGSHGGTKSTLAELQRLLVDPNSATLRTLPREERELFIQSRNAHLLCFNNVSAIPAFISDCLCCLADGSGHSVRSLFTDDDEVLFSGAHPIVLNGIEDFIVRPDLADRTITVTLQEITEEKRREKSELLAKFDEARPLILGALLDAMAHGLRRLPDLRLARLPRLADFATWATACETACFESGAFISAFERNREDAVRTVLEADAVALAVLEFMEARTDWSGTATELLGCLGVVVGEVKAKAKDWPKAAHILSGRLRRAAPFLRKRGIGFDDGHSSDHAWGRRLSLSHPGDREAETASAASAAYISNENNNLRADAASNASVGANYLNNNSKYAADAADAPLPLPATAVGEKQYRGTGNGQGGVHVCAQCQLAAGKAIRCDAGNGSEVWLHRECRPFWLVAKRSAWR